MSDTIDLVLPNIAEFGMRHPRLALDPATVDGFLRFGRAMSDQSVFWSGGPRVLVLPAGVDAEWFADVHRALDMEPPPVVCPQWRSGRLTADLLADVDAMASLRGELQGHQRVQFVSWGATEGLYQLSAAIRGMGHQVMLDVPAEEGYWSSLYLDSKMSCLDMASQIPDLRVAPGVTTDTWQELRGVLDVMLAAGERVIVRSMYGAAGEGSAVVDPEPGSLERFWRTLRDDPLLRVFPLLVQNYLPHHPDMGCPAVDMLIAGEDTGESAGEGAADGIADLVPSVMTVEGHRFVSVNVGHGLIPDAVAGQMTDISRRVAAAARRLGFRGWFGIDFLLDRHGDLYVTEFNARRTGGTQWIPLLDRWHPARRAVAHAQHVIPVPEWAPAPLCYSDVRPAFEQLWREGVPVFPIATRYLSHRTRSYGIVAGGADAEQAERHARHARLAIEARLAHV